MSRRFLQLVGVSTAPEHDAFPVITSRALTSSGDTVELRSHLECTLERCTNRAELLRREIAEREAELADVMKASGVARAAVTALNDGAVSSASLAALEAELAE